MAVEALTGVGGDLPAFREVSQPRAAGTEFMAMLGDGLARTDAGLREADAQVRSLAAGEDIPLHDLMITMERARLDLMLVAEVRNRLVEAYQELMRMQL